MVARQAPRRLRARLRPKRTGGVRRMDVTAHAQADSQPTQASYGTAQPAGAAAGAPGDLTAVPSLKLSDTQLADLELLLSGAFAPLAGFMTIADVAAVADSWQLADGTPFPVPVPQEAARVALADPEGTPLAVLQITERTPLDDTGLVRLAGPVTAQRVPEHG